MQTNTIKGIAFSACVLMAGCSDGPIGLAKLSEIKPVAFVRQAVTQNDAPTEPDAKPSLAATNVDVQSDVINHLLSRQSVLRNTSPYAPVAKTILDSSSGLAQAELRAANMRAVARSKNWLPQIGPSISLSSLGELAAGILVEQVLFDNGKRKAERAFAAADVEVSAVALSQDMNDRLHTGLTLFITAAEAREKAEMAERALDRMNEFNRIVSVRVTGGLSSLSDQRIVRTKITDMQQQASTHREAESASLAELATMTGGQHVVRLQNAHAIPTPAWGITSLDVLRAEAEAKRSIAEADAAKAGLLPSLSVGGLIGKGGSGAIDLGGGNSFGAGNRAEFEALEAEQTAATARIALARESAARSQARGHSELTALLRQERDAADLVQQNRANFRLFQDQFEGGQKTLMDVVNVYEQMIVSELRHIDLKYKTTLTQLEIARMSGNLARGADI